MATSSFGEKGDTFLTVDLGGGTVGVLALTVRDDGMLSEVSLGSGGLVGGQNINDAFFQACTDAFKGHVWMKVANKSHAIELFEMESDFESKKVVLGSETPRDEHMRLTMPECFRSPLENGEIQLKDSEEVQHRFKIENGRFLFSSQYIREMLFNETIQRILKFLKEILDREQVRDVKNIILVGGFTESVIVVDKIKEFLDENYPGKEVFVPTSPFTAVLCGAVLFGHDPLFFHSRISRATFGIEVCQDFNPEIHPEDKKVTNEETGEELCKDIFDVHVEKGESVKLGKNLHSKFYNPIYSDQVCMNISVYVSNAQHLTKRIYTTDGFCKKIGEIDVEMPDTTEGTFRDVTVTMIYGGTELDVIAKNETTGEEYTTTLRFDTA